MFRKKKSNDFKLAEAMSEIFTDIMMGLTKYEIVMRATTGHLLKPHDIPYFSERVVIRASSAICDAIKASHMRIDRIRMHEYAKIVEDAVENEARLVGLWNETPHDPGDPPQEVIDNINAELRKHGLREW